MRLAALALAARLAVCLAAGLAARPASAQREAISSSLSPEAVAQAFRNAVVEVCTAAVTGEGVGALPAARRGEVRPTSDPEMRRQAGAAPDETVWDVMAARGVVTIHERKGRCVVSAYGPAARDTIAATAQALIGPPGFQRMAQPAISKNGLEETLSFSFNGRAVIARLSGSEPGMPSHKSRFSVVTATVFIAS
jgi:hypothetical protein